MNPKHMRTAHTPPAYDVVYSKRKTIGLQIERDARLIVRAPLGVTPEHIAKVVAAKSLWIYAKTRHSPKLVPDAPRKERLNGETMPYLGRNYRLQFKAAEGEAFSLRFRGQFILTNAEDANLRAAFRGWYEERGREWLSRRVAHFSRLMGATPKGVTVSNVSASWGSCSPGGVLNFNWRLVKAPTRVVDYIVVHELAHLLEPNHTPRFWNIIAVQLPDYKVSREWLVKHGADLEREF